MLAIGNDELGELLDKTVECPHCGNEHEVEFGKDTKGNISKKLSFYTCGKLSYLCGINGKSIMPRFKKETIHPL